MHFKFLNIHSVLIQLWANWDYLISGGGMVVRFYVNVGGKFRGLKVKIVSRWWSLFLIVTLKEIMAWWCSYCLVRVNDDGNVFHVQLKCYCNFHNVLLVLFCLINYYLTWNKTLSVVLMHFCVMVCYSLWFLV